MWTCKHCNNQFDYTRTTEKANHSRHCDSNPKKKESYVNIKKANNDRIDKIHGKLVDFHVNCFCCGSSFVVVERENQYPTKEQYFCSRSCSNSIGGKAKADKYHSDADASYRTVAWRYHEKRCVVCGEDKVVAVHHLNEVHMDNRPENLIPLCPTHHQYMHSRYREFIQDKIDEYIKVKWG